jgi:hypothetical protein
MSLPLDTSSRAVRRMRSDVGTAKGERPRGQILIPFTLRIYRRPFRIISFNFCHSADGKGPARSDGRNGEAFEGDVKMQALESSL